MSNPPDTPPTRDAALTLREITTETLRTILNLAVADDQKHFVAPNAVSVAEAYFAREHAWFRAIYADETPVGFLMLYDDPEKAVYYLWRFMIDARYQGLGYGRRAIQLLIDHVKGRPNAHELKLSCVPGEHSPGVFYERLGFVFTGEEEEGELVMRLSL